VFTKRSRSFREIVRLRVWPRFEMGVGVEKLFFWGGRGVVSHERPGKRQQKQGRINTNY